MTDNVKIKYRPDGSIDTAYHMAQGRFMRSLQAHKLAKKGAELAPKLAPKFDLRSAAGKAPSGA